MSTHVVGIKPPDDNWKKMKAVYDSCVAAEIDVPDEILDYFGISDSDVPDERGVAVDLPIGVTKEWCAEMRDGIEVDLSKLPEGIKILRFYNSY